MQREHTPVVATPGGGLVAVVAGHSIEIRARDGGLRDLACEDVHQIDKRKLLARVGHMPLRNRQGVAAVVWLRLVQLSIADKDPWQGVDDSSEDDDWFYH